MHDAKMIRKKNFIYLLALIVLSSCQSENGNAELVNPIGQRKDSTGVYSVDSQIMRPAGVSVLNRSIPYTEDRNISYCESVNGAENQYNGFRDQSLYPLASVSKVFLSAFALDVLGADFKFQNQWYFKKTNQAGIYDVYFKANYDPVLNIEKMLYAQALLRQKGVQGIRQLIIDESTRVYLSVLNNPHIELEQVPVGIEQSIDNLMLIFNSKNWRDQAQIARSNLQIFLNSKGIKLSVPNSFSVQQVIYQPSKNIKTKDYSDLINIKSSLLLKYLKDINVNSNNYISDALFYYLGGAKAFKKFQNDRLRINDQDLRFYTGSGLAQTLTGTRTDNGGTCVSVLKVLKFIDGLSKQSYFNLGQLLLTAGYDNGTYEPTQAINFNKSVVVKTGRLYDVSALNLAGTVKLKDDRNLYFAYLSHYFDNSNEQIYMKKRDQMLDNLLKYYPTQSGFTSLSLNSLFLE